MNKSKPLVSVIIATWNRPVLLKECLSALSQQTFKDFEICLINNGGTSAADTLAKFPSLSIRYHSFPQNRGIAAARNQGVRMASGEFIAICDDDDLYLSTHLESLVESIQENDLVYSDGELVRFMLENSRHVPVDRRNFAFEFDRSLLRRTNFILISAVLYRRSLHDSLGFFDEKLEYHDDWDWYLRGAEKGKITRVPQASVLCGINPQGDSSSSKPEITISSLKRLCEKHGLGDLSPTNFDRMAQDPALEPWRRPTKQLWHGNIFWN